MNTLLIIALIVAMGATAYVLVRGVIAMDGRMISVITMDNVLPAGMDLEAA